MAKIIITYEGIPELEAVTLVKTVMNSGLVSKNYTQYCYITTFTAGAKVYADKTKAGNFTFRVLNKDVA